MDTLDFITLKHICFAEDPLMRMKRQTTAGKEYLQMTYATKDMYPEYIKNSLNPTARKQTVQLEKGTKT